MLLNEALGDAAALGIAVLRGAPVERGQEDAVDRSEVIAGRDRDEVLPADALTARLDAALSRRCRVWCAGGRSRTRRVVRGERMDPSGQLALGADQHLGHGGPKVVVEQPERHRAEVRERADVPGEERNLILAIRTARRGSAPSA